MSPLILHARKFLLLILILNSQIILGQSTQEGKDFRFGIPHSIRSTDESVRWGNYAVYLMIHSRYDGYITISSADGSIPLQNHQVSAGETKIIVIPDYLETKGSEVVEPNGIHILSEVPIDVTVMTAYNFTGEAFKLISYENLGKKYYTLNLYQDQCKMNDHTVQYTPGEILIIASEDGTSGIYQPNATTVKGIAKGKTGSFSLGKGETFLIQSKTMSALNQTDESDLTGTFIMANKPIVVMSGHTKGAYPRYPAIFNGDLKSDFMRNMLMEIMPPVNTLGTEYVSAPILYKYRNNYGTIDDDSGDLIRLVATEGQTEISYTDKNGDKQQLAKSLSAGEWVEISSQEYPSVYTSNHPILIGQYGKSWWSEPENVEKGRDNPLTPNQSGQGMLMTLVPVRNWVDYAQWYAPEDIDNYFYITFSESDFYDIKLDGEYIYKKYHPIEIPGSSYRYVISETSTGHHFMESDNDVHFAVYAYGNYDAYNEGFAYGYPAASNYNGNCEDSIVIDVESKQFVYDLNIEVRGPDDCAKLKKIDIINDPDNPFEIEDNDIDPLREKEVSYQLQPTNPLYPAKIEFQIYSYGSYWEYVIEHEPVDLNPPILYEPHDEAWDLYPPFNFTWSGYYGFADTFDIQISTDTLFSQGLVIDKMDYYGYRLDSVYIPAGDVYYWRVRSKDGDKISDWSEVWTFSVAFDAYLNRPIILEPDFNSEQEAPVELKWSINNEAFSSCELYLIRFEENWGDAETDTIRIQNIKDSSWALGYEDLRMYRYHLFEVRVILDSMIGPWALGTFTPVSQEGFDACNLISPEYGDYIDSSAVHLTWNKHPYADKGYDILFWTENSIIDVEKFVNISDTVYQINGLDKDSTYYWTVRACYENYKGPWSGIWNFSTEEKSGLDGLPENQSVFKIINISPNPAQGHVNIELSSIRDEKEELKLVNALGQEVHRQEINISGGINSISLELPGSLPNGAYILIIDTGSGQLSAKLVIE